MGKMKIFLDTNVLIDYLNKREPFFTEASQVMDLCISKRVEAALSSLSIINAAYIMRKAYPKNSLLLKISWLTEKFEVCPINRDSIQRAAASRPFDFEDAVQYFSALQANADLIITRDTKGFADFDLPVMTPAEFLARCAE